MAYSVRERQIGFTANLFVRKEVFEKIGKFSEQLTSGGDVLFTSQATSAGFEIVYACEAVVEHPTRGFGSLLRKAFRVGKGKADALWLPRVKELGNGSLIKREFLLRLNPMVLKQRIDNGLYDIGKWMFFKVLLVAYLVMAVNIIGAMCSILFRSKKSNVGSGQEFEI